jgi:hypothetical protein
MVDMQNDTIIYWCQEKIGMRVEKNLECIVCGSRVTAEIQGLFDTRFGIENFWNIGRCTDCEIEQTS